MINLAVLYVAQDAPFLGVVQVIVYTGAVMMLFVFVLMLVGVDASDSLVETIKGQRVDGRLLGGLSSACCWSSASARLPSAPRSGWTRRTHGGNVQGIGEHHVHPLPASPSRSPRRC